MAKAFDEQPNEEAIALFKKKGLAISKLSGMGSHKKKFELKKMKDEKEIKLQKEKENTRWRGLCSQSHGVLDLKCQSSFSIFSSFVCIIWFHTMKDSSVIEK